jgi:hypothetical protein
MPLMMERVGAADKLDGMKPETRPLMLASMSPGLLNARPAAVMMCAGAAKVFASGWHPAATWRSAGISGRGRTARVFFSASEWPSSTG